MEISRQFSRKIHSICHESQRIIAPCPAVTHSGGSNGRLFGQFLPQLFELLRELFQQASIMAQDDVFFIEFTGAARPVIASIEQPLSVEQGKLVVHMRFRAIYRDGDARVAQSP